MASKRRVRRNAHEGKFSYATFKLAVDAATATSRRTGTERSPYRCSFCKKYHIGRVSYKARALQEKIAAER